MMDFRETIRDFVIDRLDEMEDAVVYGYDLASELTMDENMTGVYIIGTNRAKDFIAEYFNEANDTWRYFSEELGVHLNPFETPETYTVYMLIYGVETMLHGVKYLNDHWDDKITLDKATIGIIAAQIEEDEDEEAVYYLMQHSYLAESDARYLITYWADDPLPWAETYAPYIIELWDESDDPEQWERDNPDDHVITDAGLTCPIVISATPVRY